jgi:hypothetical protein
MFELFQWVVLALAALVGLLVAFVIIYVVARLVVMAYFRSKSEYERKT